MYRDGIVGILIGILGVHTLGHWRECISQTLVLLHLLTLLWSE